MLIPLLSSGNASAVAAFASVCEKSGFTHRDKGPIMVLFRKIAQKTYRASACFCHNSIGGGKLMEDAEKGKISHSLVAGAALYWTSALLSLVYNDALSSMGALHLGGSGASEHLWLSTPAIAVLLCLSVAFSRFFSFERFRKVLLAGIVVSAFAVMFLASSKVYVPEDLVAPYLTLLMALRAVESSGMILLWGFAFASLDKRTAGQTVALTALCAVLGYLCLVVLMQFVPQVYVVQPLYVLSSLVMLSGRIRFSDIARSLTPFRAKRIRFYVSRAAWGVVIGFAHGFVGSTGFDPSGPFLVMGLVAVAGLLVAYALSKENLYTVLPVFPLVVVGLVFIPFVLEGLLGIAQSSVAMMWVAWILLSSFQLSGLKESFGMSETSICFSEKAVLMTGWSVGLFGAISMGNAGLLIALDSKAAEALALIATYAVVVYATYSVFSSVYSRREDQLLDEMARSREERMSNLYDSIAREYGLSTREREVMEMLAQGYTRTYIRDKLVISDGTAKAHIAHVYQKLDIHKKDDLLRLVKASEEKRPFR